MPAKLETSGPPPWKLLPCRPDARQSTLLRACLAKDPESARKLAAEWLAVTDVFTAESASTRLLPMLFSKLAAAGFEHKEMARMRGVHRHTWARNQRVFHRAAKLVRGLQDNGIECLMLKGLPLALTCYGTVGDRPMEDADLLVRPSQAVAACQIVEKLGWKNSTREPVIPRGWTLEQALWLHHARGFVSEDEDFSMDLHWHSLIDCCHQEADVKFWERRVPLTFSNVKTWTLCPEDHLLHVCLHGLRLNPLASIRWVADAVMVGRNAGNGLRWEIVLQEAADRGLELPMRDALEFLKEDFGLEVPTDVIAKLRSARPTLIEKWAHRGRTSGWTPGRGAMVWQRFEQATPHMGRLRRFKALPAYLKGSWFKENNKQILAHAAERLWHSIAPGKK